MTREEVLKTAKPIILDSIAINAIRNGRKTIMRQVIKPPAEVHEQSDGIFVTRPRSFPDEYCRFVPFSPFNVNDILYVRETWAHNNITPNDPELLYKADYDCTMQPYCNWKWQPSARMAKNAARIFLKITDVWVERLKDIPLSDIQDEGTPQMPGNSNTDGAVGHDDFAYFWDNHIKWSDIAKFGWNANPWVWVLSFTQIKVDGE